MRSVGIRGASRRFLAAVGAVVVCGVMVQAQPAPAAAPGLGDGKIQHVVLIYQENHSFDETLGYVCKLRATPCDGFTRTVTLSDGTPFRMKVSPDVVPEAAHFVKAQNIAINGGLMNGFDKIGGCKSKLHHCISYYKPRQIPNLAALADQYVVADRTFEMAASPSWGGHIYPVAGTLDGFTGDSPLYTRGNTVPRGVGWGCDSNKDAPWVSPEGDLLKVPSCVPFADGTGAYEPTPVQHVPTIFDQLDAAGKSWRLYGAPQPAAGEDSPGYIWSICPNFADCIETPRIDNMLPSTKILTAAERGNLPKYSIVTPSGYSDRLVHTKSSQHNGTSMMAGDNWIGQVVSAIQNGPDWDSTAIFITYDDCGCFYDHVPPPGPNPDGTETGVRIPMVVVSPWAKPGYTDHNVATLPSLMAFTEHVFGLDPIGVNDAAAYDFSDSFDFSQTPQKPRVLKDHKVPQTSLDFIKTLPTDFWDEEDAYTVPAKAQQAYEAYEAKARAAGDIPAG